MTGRATVEVQATFAAEVEGDRLSAAKAARRAERDVRAALKKAGFDVRDVRLHVEAHEGLEASEPVYRTPTTKDLEMGVELVEVDGEQRVLVEGAQTAQG